MPMDVLTHVPTIVKIIFTAPLDRNIRRLFRILNAAAPGYSGSRR